MESKGKRMAKERANAMRLELKPGGLSNFAIDKDESRKRPKVQSIAFATNWRTDMHKEDSKFPLAVGMDDGIEIWLQASSGEWGCCFSKKCEGGVKILAWHIAEATLAFSGQDGIICLVKFNSAVGFELSEFYQDPMSRVLCSISWNFAGFLAATFPSEENWECFIFEEASTSAIKEEHFSVNGPVSRLVPFLNMVLIGGPAMDIVEIYNYSPDPHKETGSDYRGSQRWHFITSIYLPGGISDINVFAPDCPPLRDVVSFVGCNSEVYLYEVNHNVFSATSRKRKKIEPLSHLHTIDKQEDRVPLSVAWESIEKIAICYNDTAILICIDVGDKKYMLTNDTFIWDAQLKRREKPKLLIDWPRPGQAANNFHIPVLAVVGEDHGFMNFFELRDNRPGQPGTAIANWDIASEVKYYAEIPASVEATSSQTESREEAEDITLDPSNQIFCNMPVHMDGIKAIGFEMEYGAAEYDVSYLNTNRCINALGMLVLDKKYPDEIRSLVVLNPSTMIRGLLIDKKNGNFLKVDKHQYVDIAFHGLRQMQPNEKHSTYGAVATKDRFDLTEYAVLDTFSSIAEATLFAYIIDYMDKFPGKIKKEYEDVYRDIISVFQTLYVNEMAYGYHLADCVTEDKTFELMIKELRSRGMKTFLLSSCTWKNTNTVMSYICETTEVKNGWLDNFDVVVTSTGRIKKTFFSSDEQEEVLRVNVDSGYLENKPNMKVLEANNDNKVFQGGDIGHLLARLDVSREEVLYVTHQINRDVLCSPGWRTFVVIPELKQELESNSSYQKIKQDLNVQKRKFDLVECKIHMLEKMKSNTPAADTYQQKLTGLISQKDDIQQRCEDLEGSLPKFDAMWGMLMKTGYKKSLFADEVERNASLYTTKATNLAYYPPGKRFDVIEDFMDHDYVQLSS